MKILQHSKMIKHKNTCLTCGCMFVVDDFEFLKIEGTYGNQEFIRCPDCDSVCFKKNFEPWLDLEISTNMVRT